MKRQAAERRGRTAETIAAWWLRLHGWRIVARRAKTHVGDLDLGLALDRRRLQRVARAAEMLGPRYTRSGDDIRIDAVLVKPWRVPKHLSNVWLG